MEKYLNYEILCRICLQETLDKEKGLFDVLIDNVKYADVIKLIAQIDVDPDDSLPNRLCGMCEDSLVDVYKLRELCLKSNDLLQTQENNSYDFKEEADIANGDVIRKDEIINAMDNSNAPALKEEEENGDVLISEIYNSNAAPIEDEHKTTTNDDDAIIKTVKIESETHTCQPCNKSFLLLSDYDNHNKEKHSPVVRRPHQCQRCPLRFSKREDLIKHMRRHMRPKIVKDATKRIVIQKPQRSTGTSAAISKYSYKNIDPQDKPFACTTCPGRFTTEYYLKIHERIHTGIKPYVCRICGTQFARSTYLRQHEKFHTGIRDHPCDLCPKRFYSSGDLRVHRRLHTGEKPFPCEFCGNRYRRRADLKTHLKLHIGENTYVCTKCEATFRFSVELREHLRDHFLAEKEATAQT